jgi:hypothetical protein
VDLFDTLTLTDSGSYSFSPLLSTSVKHYIYNYIKTIQNKDLLEDISIFEVIFSLLMLENKGFVEIF